MKHVRHTCLSPRWRHKIACFVQFKQAKIYKTLTLQSEKQQILTNDIWN